jgi:hypothetical protein
MCANATDLGAALVDAKGHALLPVSVQESGVTAALSLTD